MASIRRRSRKDGSTFWSLLWREGGSQRSLSFHDASEAEHWKTILESSGGSMNAALVGESAWASAMHSVAVFLDKNYPCRCETAEECAGNISEAEEIINISEAEEIIRIVRSRVSASG